jgi:glycerol-3-phosphate acyltransferase PlsY
VTRTPRTTAPGGGTAYTPGRTGSFLGGLATGAILGHLLNPFSGFGWGGGYGYGAGGGFGFSVISLLIWAVLLYAVYRIIRRLFGGRGGGGRYR